MCFLNDLRIIDIAIEIKMLIMETGETTPLKYPNGPAKFPLGPAKFADEEIPMESDTASQIAEPSSSATDSPSKGEDTLRKTRNKWTDEEPLPLAQENLHYERFSEPEFLRLVAPAPTAWRLPLHSYRPSAATFASLEIPWENIAPSIYDIFKLHALLPTNVDLQHRRPTSDPIEIKDLTILVTMATRDHAQDWRPALAQIRKYLKDTQKPVVSSLPVEMVTAATFGRWWYGPAKIDSPVAQLWNDKLRKLVVDIIHDMPWSVIDLLTAKFIYSDDKWSEEMPMVSIVGHPSAMWDSRWPKREAEIGRLFDSHGFGDMRVQVRQVVFFPACIFNPGR